MVMIRATIAKNAKRKAKHKSTLGELPNVSGTFPGLIADSFQHDLSGVFSGVVKPFTKSMHTDKTDISWGFSMNFGNNERHNNISPVIGVYAWRRQA